MQGQDGCVHGRDQVSEEICAAFAIVSSSDRFYFGVHAQYFSFQSQLKKFAMKPVKYASKYF